MNWDAITAISEAIGVVAVVASVLYLAAQVRQANRASSVAAKQVSTQLLSDFADDIIKDPELMELWLRGRKGTSALTELENLRFAHMCLKAFWFFSAAEYQKRLGTLDEESWAEFQSVIRFWLDGAGVRTWWEHTGRNRFGKSFVLFIDDETRAREV